MLKTDFTPVIFATDVTSLNDEALFSKAYEGMSVSRKAKIDKMRMRSDKNLSLGAGLLLKYALKQIGIDEEPEIYLGENGKPYFKNCDVYFNISHSANLVICSIAPFEIGCDIEFNKDINLDIANRFFSNEEYTDIISSPDGTVKFYRYWTLKESFMKVTGLGMKLPLHSFSVSLKPPITVDHKVNQNEYFFKEFFEFSDYACAICGVKDCSKTAFTFLDDIKKITVNAL